MIMKKGKIKVLIVDDSAFMRKILSDIISKDSELDLVGAARDGEDALRKKDLLKPDVITLDVEMPRLDGLATLRRIMEKGLMPVIMVSSLTSRGSETTLEALSAGAVDFIAKPTALYKGEGLDELRLTLPQKIKAAAGARLFSARSEHRPEHRPEPRKLPGGKPSGPGASSEPVASSGPTAPGASSSSVTETPGISRLSPRPVERSTSTPTPPSMTRFTGAAGAGAGFVVLIGSSTGGPRALEDIFRYFPEDFPAAVLVTQHMPPSFTASLAKRLDKISGIKVQEAKGRERISPGHAYIAPGGFHLLVQRGETSLSQAPPVHHVRPAADLMMESAARYYKSKAIGVILTGMGRDGTDGMAEIKKNGGRTIVQDPATAVISSMPQSVIDKGLADVTVPLGGIVASVIRFFS